MSDDKKHCYEFPRPALSVDILLRRSHAGRDEVLLIERKNEPFKGRWAFPGGFVDENESLEDAAKRELNEETGLRGLDLRQFRAFGDPGRDPRGHTVTVVFLGHTFGETEVKGGDDAASARWFPMDALPELAFDHAKILRLATEQKEKKSAGF